MPVSNSRLIILFLALSVFSQSILKISGKVLTVDGVRVKGAIVSLQKNAAKDTTDSTGSFLIIDTLRKNPVVKNAVCRNLSSYNLTFNKINVNLPERTTVCIEIFDISGKKIETIVNSSFKAGNYNIPIGIHSPATQICFVRLKIGAQTAHFKLYALEKTKFTQMNTSQVFPLGIDKKIGDIVIDTLIISQNCFIPVKLPIIDTVSSVVIMLNRMPCIPQVIAVTEFGPLKDTIISQKDSLLVGIGAKDSSGTISEYYWDIGGNGWCDSTSRVDSAIKYLKYPSGGYIPIIIGARNSVGYLGTDTIHILFNRPPSSCGLKTGCESDTCGWYSFDNLTGTGSVRASFIGIDPDSMHDHLKFDLYWGTKENYLTHQYLHLDSMSSISGIPIQTAVFWKVVVRDLYGDTVAQNGKFFSGDRPPAGIFWDKSAYTPYFYITPDFTDAYFMGADQFSMTSYQDKLWAFVFRGYYRYEDSTYVTRSLFCSDDGMNWNKVTDNPILAVTNISSPGQFSMTSYQNKLWLVIFNGFIGNNSVAKVLYNSTDGSTWNQVTNKFSIDSISPSFTGKVSMTSFDNKLWLFFSGCYIGNRYVNNAEMNSMDGITWNMVTDNPSIEFTCIPDNENFSMASYENKLWIILPFGYKDIIPIAHAVYNSSDGIAWNKIPVSPIVDFPAAEHLSMTSYKNQLWAFYFNSRTDSTGYNNNIILTTGP